jgi:hypothetical protein
MGVSFCIFVTSVSNPGSQAKADCADNVRRTLVVTNFVYTKAKERVQGSLLLMYLGSVRLRGGKVMSRAYITANSVKGVIDERGL